MATLAVVGLAACATPATVPPAPVASTPEARQAQVGERSQARWVALIKDDMDTAYGFLSPGSRQAITLDNFKAKNRRGAFREAKVESVTCEEDVCKARVLLTYDHRQMKGITTPVSEAWIFEGGQAWFVN